MPNPIQDSILAASAKIAEAAAQSAGAVALDNPEKMVALIQNVATALQGLKDGDEPKR